jgi:hypothetical protein
MLTYAHTSVLVYEALSYDRYKATLAALESVRGYCVISLIQARWNDDVC